MSQADMELALQFLKAIADGTRLKILGILAQSERSVEELAALLDVKPPTVSHHLNKLRDIQLVQMRPEGNTHYYSFRPDSLIRLNKELLTPERLVTFVDTSSTDAWARKVLRDFLNGEELKEIPASRKKRLVVLKWLVNDFDTDRRYTETEVNELIKRHHPDFATLRREFIGNQLMDRADGYYWRTGGA